MFGLSVRYRTLTNMKLEKKDRTFLIDLKEVSNEGQGIPNAVYRSNYGFFVKTERLIYLNSFMRLQDVKISSMISPCGTYFAAEYPIRVAGVN